MPVKGRQFLSPVRQPFVNYFLLLNIRIKSMHLIGWTLSMWPSLFRDTDWVADIDRSKNRVLTGATGLFTVFGPVYISINRNFKTPSMILIKSTLKMFICLYVRFYLFLELQFLLRFLDSWKNLYFVCLQFNKYNSYWYRG